MGVALSTPLIGANTDRRTTTQEFKLGTVALGTDGSSYTYVKASAAVAAAAVVVLTVPAFTIATGAGTHTADTAFAINEYGWARRTTSGV